MKKYLRVTMPDGSKWDVPAMVIAENRAASFHPIGTEEFLEEAKLTIGDAWTLTDWAENNMNRSDVKLHAVQVGATKVNHQEGWVNGPKEVVEHE